MELLHALTSLFPWYSALFRKWTIGSRSRLRGFVLSSDGPAFFGSRDVSTA